MGVSTDRGLLVQYRRAQRQLSAQKKKATWYCDACAKYHGIKVDRLGTLDGRTICFRQHYREMDGKVDIPKPGHPLIKKITKQQEDVEGAAPGTTRLVYRAVIGFMAITDFDPDKTAEILTYMDSIVTEHVGAGQEVNGTTLAEAAAAHFDLYLPDNEATIPEDVFELSHAVGKAWEAKQTEE